MVSYEQAHGRQPAHDHGSILAVIFDFDGTLVDSMSLHFEAYRQAFEDFNLTLIRATFDEAVGGTAADAIPRMLRTQVCPVDISILHRQKQRHLERLIDERNVDVLPASLLLPIWAGRIPMAVASSGSRPGIEKMLRRLNWTNYFEVVVTGEDVRIGKPDPEAFMLAAEGLSVDPERCLVFEDTDAGVISARAAGMAVVDVRHWCLTTPS